LRARQLLFPGSSAVEQPAVNRLVAGSNPARGANKIKHLAQHHAPDKICKLHVGRHLGQQFAKFSEGPMARRLSPEDYRLLDEMNQRGGDARISDGRPRHGVDRLVGAGFATSRL
jgi:hypothetical protein